MYFDLNSSMVSDNIESELFEHFQFKADKGQEKKKLKSRCL